MAVGILAVLVVASPHAARAQTGSVTGTVVEGTNRRPIVGAQVFVKGTALATQAGEGGRFTLANIPPGPHTIGVRQIGFAAAEKPVSIVAGRRDTLDFVPRILICPDAPTALCEMFMMMPAVRPLSS
jgi:hypothetical protein